MGLDGRPSAIHITLQSQLVGLALSLVGGARAWDSFDSSNELSYVFVGGLGAQFLGLLALELSMHAAQRRGAGPIARVSARRRPVAHREQRRLAASACRAS